MKITHDKFKAFNMSTSAKKIAPQSKVLFDESFETARRHNPELDKHIKKAMDDLNPVRVLKLFRKVQDSDCELLGLRSARPEAFLWQYIPAPPVPIRPSVGQDGASTEDDLTAKLGDIIGANGYLREALHKGAPIPNIMEHWDYLTLCLAMYINGDAPGQQKGEHRIQMRSFVQRLKGKQGRFRQNLSGKRVDFSGRTVISPDPNLNIDEVAVPILIAKNMTYPEVVSQYNRKRLQDCVVNGNRKWPGANYVYKAGTDIRLFLRYGNRQHIAEQLQEGDRVERHLTDGDIVLFNRQPSLHKLSILSHFVKVRPHRTFRLNECVCNPYNADFDGDEMNLHVPQTEEARTEAVELMGVKHNIVTPKNGEPIISAIQDFVSAAFLLSSLDVFYDRKTFVTICLTMLEDKTRFDLPSPAVIKPQMFWTGKQVFNVLMRPNGKSDVRVNIDAACREHKQIYKNIRLAHRDLQDDTFLCIRNSEIMCGKMDKSTIGSGKKNSLFYVLYRDYGPNAAAEGMNRLSKLCARWLSDRGFSVGIDDVTPPPNLVDRKTKAINKAFDTCEEALRDSKAGKLKRRSGLDDAATLEGEQIKALGDVRTDMSKVLNAELSRGNTPMIMATSGSKGSTVNVAQMAALLGQQDIEGKRVADGFQDRTLPHFGKHERSPASKGFVSNSFFSGLNPYEFLFHAVGGRVGLVDTAVKTAETGYMSRRLMKSLEDLFTHYDRTVRNSSSNIVQFRFGDDELDPVDMEASAKPVDFERTFAHVASTTFNLGDPGLNSHTILDTTEEMLRKMRERHERADLRGVKLPYNIAEQDEKLADQDESAREFIDSISEFVRNTCERFNAARKAKANYATAKSLSSAQLAILTNDKQFVSAELPQSKAISSSSSPHRRSARNQRGRAAAEDPGDHRPNTRTRLPSKPSTPNRFELTSKISAATLTEFVRTCFDKYEKARVEPGHAVGAVGAQSIGEPGTQMTLKTFHFAGVAGMSLTGGVPRIKEIINASKAISTPIITCKLVRRNDGRIPEWWGRIVKGRIESLVLEDVAESIETDWYRGRAGSLSIRISLTTIAELGLDVTVQEIFDCISKHRRFKTAGVKMYLVKPNRIVLSLDRGVLESKKPTASKLEDGETRDPFLKLQYLRRFLPGLHVLGHPLATRAVVMAEDDPESDDIKAKEHTARQDMPQGAIKTEGQGSGEVKPEKEESGGAMRTATKQKARAKTSAKPIPAVPRAVKSEDEGKKVVEARKQDEKPVQMHKVMVEGYGLRYCMNTEGVDPYHTSTNSIIETLQVLGIEAARKKIILEIAEVMRDLSIDPRHMALLADVMTYKGEVLGITRFGLAKMRDSVLQLASFEKTADHVFDAGIAGKIDRIKGVSECVIVGKTMGVGTGSVEVVRNMLWQEGDTGKNGTVFEDCWKELYEKKRSGRMA